MGYGNNLGNLYREPAQVILPPFPVTIFCQWCTEHVHGQTLPEAWAAFDQHIQAAHQERKES